MMMNKWKVYILPSLVQRYENVTKASNLKLFGIYKLMVLNN